MGVPLPFPGLRAELPLCAAVTRGPPSTGLTWRPPATMLKLRSWFHATAYCSLPTLKPRGTARLGTSCRLGDGGGGGGIRPPTAPRGHLCHGLTFASKGQVADGDILPPGGLVTRCVTGTSSHETGGTCRPRGIGHRAPPHPTLQPAPRSATAVADRHALSPGGAA